MLAASTAFALRVTAPPQDEFKTRPDFATISACGPNERGSTTMTRFASQARPLIERADSGFILIVVLWMLAALATLVSIGSVYAIETAVASRVPDDRLQTEAALRAGCRVDRLSGSGRAQAAAADPRSCSRPRSDRREFPFGSVRRPRGSISTQHRRRF